MPIFKARIVQLPAGQTPHPPAPLGLTMSGPIVQIQVEVPEALSKQLSDSGQPIPQPVTGSALIDTGATFSAIDMGRVAKKLGLNPIATAKSGTADGEKVQPIFSVKFVLPQSKIVVSDGRATGVNLDGSPYIALLGRSFLQNVIMIYDGPGAEFTLAL